MPDTRDDGLRSYPAPWKGEIVLVCRKCQKKLRHGKKNKLAKLGKELKKRTEQLRVVEVSCMKMCPKDGVTACTRQQLSRNECCIVRSSADIDSLVGVALR